MKLLEIQFEICRAQLARSSSAGKPPLITSIVFHPLDDIGRSFSCRATFAYGSDYITQFTLDDPADLTDADWQLRFDNVMFDGNGESRWPH